MSNMRKQQRSIYSQLQRMLSSPRGVRLTQTRCPMCLSSRVGVCTSSCCRPAVHVPTLSPVLTLQCIWHNDGCDDECEGSADGHCCHRICDEVDVRLDG